MLGGSSGPQGPAPGAGRVGKGQCWGLAGPRRLPGACASISSISSVPAARGTVWGSQGGGAGSGGGCARRPVLGF